MDALKVVRGCDQEEESADAVSARGPLPLVASGGLGRCAVTKTRIKFENSSSFYRVQYIQMVAFALATNIDCRDCIKCAVSSHENFPYNSVE